MEGQGAEGGMKLAYHIIILYLQSGNRERTGNGAGLYNFKACPQ